MSSSDDLKTRRQDRLDRTMDAERAVLGVILREPACLDDVAVLLTPDQFRDDLHQRVYRAILDQAKANEPIDLVSVFRRLKACPGEDSLGLAQLPDHASSAGNIAYYAGLVREDWLRRRLSDFGRRLIAEADDPAGPVSDILAMAEREVFRFGEAKTSTEPLPIIAAMDVVLDRIDERMRTPDARSGLECGIGDLDTMTGGFQAGQLVVMAARPGVGKTAVAGVIAHRVASRGVPVLFFSLEQSGTEIAERLLSAGAGVNGQRIKNIRLDDDEVQMLVDARHAHAALPLHYDDTPVQSIVRIASQARRHKRRAGLGLVVVDYLQLVDAEFRQARRHEQVGEVSRRLKSLARELSVPVLALAQLNREVEGRTDGPRLSDLRESGSIEADADAVIFLHRPPEVKDSLLLEMIVAKNRCGPTGKLAVGFDRAKMRILSESDPVFA